MPIAWNRINTLLLVLVLLVLAGALARGVLGGPLDPPAPPASTMKTLDQIEPRIPISQPATAAGFPITISQPGSYFLTGNITGVAGANGITVNANEVTIDLNGFTLNGVPSSGRGINSNGWNTTIKNGGVSYWGGEGIVLFQPNARVEKVQARSNHSGIQIASGIIEDSVVTHNSQQGISIEGGTIRGSYVSFNGGNGIAGSGRMAIERNTIIENGLRGINLVSDGATVMGNTVAANGTDGILASGPTLVEDNALNANGGISIAATSGATILHNSVRSNAAGGIFADGALNRIEGNTVTGNYPTTIQFGIRVTGTHNIIVRNSASYNFDNFDIGAGNTAGPEETSTATSPWSNVNY